MKRLVIIALTCCLGFGLTACGEKERVTVVKTPADAPAAPAAPADATKTESGESN